MKTRMKPITSKPASADDDGTFPSVESAVAVEGVLSQDPEEALADNLAAFKVDDDNDGADGLIPSQEDAATEEDLATYDDSSASNDPVKIYLSQMGELPQISHEEEQILTSRLEIVRRRFGRRDPAGGPCLGKEIGTSERGNVGKQQ